MGAASLGVGEGVLSVVVEAVVSQAAMGEAMGGQGSLSCQCVWSCASGAVRLELCVWSCASGAVSGVCVCVRPECARLECAH